MGRRTLIGLAFALLTAAGTPSVAEDDAFGPLRALRANPPAPAPSGTFKTLDGKPATLDELRGRPVLLTFFTTW